MLSFPGKNKLILLNLPRRHLDEWGVELSPQTLQLQVYLLDSLWEM